MCLIKKKFIILKNGKIFNKISLLIYVFIEEHVKEKYDK